MALNRVEEWPIMSTLDGVIESGDVGKLRGVLCELPAEEQDVVLMYLFERGLEKKDWKFSKSVGELGINFERSTGDHEFDAIYQAIESLGECPDAIRWLVRKGADPNKRRLRNVTPLLLAVSKRCNESIVALLNTGADVNIADIDRNTVLMVAAEHGDLEIVELLIKSGAKLDRIDMGWRTASECARQAGFPDVADRIVFLQEQPLKMRQDLAERWKKR